MKRAKSLLFALTSAIEPLYGTDEAVQIARMVVAELGGVTRTRLLLEPDMELDVEGFDGVVRELAAGRPVQYVLGHAEFLGVDLVVREGVLVPRPETEELVLWVANETQADAKILDIGTGSGAIAVALAQLLPSATVTAVDVSERALEVARENARKNRVEVAFRQLDILKEMPTGEYDVVVSNPPYIPENERAAMHRNVVDHEPPEALFVPDTEPLLFYRAIAGHAQKLLRDGGKLYFEIHENYADQVVALLDGLGFRDTRLRHDIHSKPRMVCTEK